MQDFQHEKARLIMMLRGMGVVEADVLSAMERVPRELFVPTALSQHAYMRMPRCRSRSNRRSASPISWPA